MAALPPWWLVCAGLVLLVGAAWWLQRFLQRRVLRGALRELRELARAHARDGDTTRLARSLSRLLRRHATMRFAQDGVAGLTGGAWLRFLDDHGGEGAFCHGVGAVLESRPYRDAGAVDAAALIALVRRWLRANPL